MTRCLWRRSLGVPSLSIRAMKAPSLTVVANAVRPALRSPTHGKERRGNAQPGTRKGDLVAAMAKRRAPMPVVFRHLVRHGQGFGRCVHTNRVTLSYSCRSARVGSTLAAR
jgi:hypothetical protein